MDLCTKMDSAAEAKTVNEAVDSQEYTRRVVFECNASPSELTNGKIVRVGNPSKVFVPAKDASPVSYTHLTLPTILLV